ncbi:alpha/beta fold hydrolase [archaeon]|jgi:carboxylesterase|nr:alpha/beta fold hydrolase [archaeon]MBT3450859.1 alpha/beta fold hydrolase [archaeon]MBT6868736.1 alpha/beta fold hydrolase [archaeon]MBT7192361.1 alpha/beta fold hydrolase [archaeon]MBT7381190.1 alpha/beta fold hydrolase [archaeon]
MKKFYLLLIIFVSLLLFYFSYSNLITEFEIMVDYPEIFVGGEIIQEELVKGQVQIYDYAQPIFLEGTNNESVLLIHGYLASPQEVEELAHYLNERDYTVLAPLMSGHGTNYLDLETVSWDIWADESKYYYELLNDNYNAVHVVGFSLGSLSALELANSYELDSLVVIGTPMFIVTDWIYSDDYGSDFLVTVIGEFANYFPYPKKGNSFTDLVIGRETYSHLPTISILEVIEYSDYVKSVLGDVDDDVIILHGSFDTTADPYSAEYVFEEIGSKEKEIVYVNSLHQVLMGIHQEEVFSEISGFLGRE